MLQKTLYDLLSAIQCEIDNGSYNNYDNGIIYNIIGASQDSLTVLIVHNEMCLGKVKLSIERV